jgi:hypothetical protein
MEQYEYEELIRPTNLFKSTDEVRRFIKVRLFGDVDTHVRSLENMLARCEEDECYEWCAVIKTEIDLINKNKHNLIFSTHESQ